MEEGAFSLGFFFFIYATARSWMDVFLRVMFIWFLYAPISMLSLFAWLQNN